MRVREEERPSNTLLDLHPPSPLKKREKFQNKRKLESGCILV